MKSVKLDLSIKKGCDYSRIFQLLQSNGSPVNLTGLTMRGKMRNSYASHDYVDLHPTVVTPLTGTWKIQLTSAETAVIPFSTGVYDVEFVGVTIDEVMWGNAMIRPEVSHE